MAFDLGRIQPAQLVFPNTHCHDRNLVGRDSLGGQVVVEVKIAVAGDRTENNVGVGLPHIPDDLPVFLVPQGRVYLRNRLEAFGYQVFSYDQVGGARENGVAAKQIKLLLAASLITQEPVKGWQDLLVRS